MWPPPGQPPVYVQQPANFGSGVGQGIGVGVGCLIAFCVLLVVMFFGCSAMFSHP
jgi:hypothetical protein